MSHIIAPEGAICGVDVRGGAPATRETDLLKTEKMAEKVHGVFLSEGSTYGLNAAADIMDFLEEKEIGFDAGIGVVPIVTDPSLFDLAISSNKSPHDRRMGYKTCENAFSRANLEKGTARAGTGATIGKICRIERMMKGGLGIYGLKLET